MKQNLKTKISQVRFLLSPLEKAYLGELLGSDLLTEKGKKLLDETVERILKDEGLIVENLKRRKLSILQKLEKFVSSDYKGLLKKGKALYETFLNEDDLKKIEIKMKNI